LFFDVEPNLNRPEVVDVVAEEDVVALVADDVDDGLPNVNVGAAVLVDAALDAGSAKAALVVVAPDDGANANNGFDVEAVGAAAAADDDDDDEVALVALGLPNANVGGGNGALLLDANAPNETRPGVDGAHAVAAALVVDLDVVGAMLFALDFGLLKSNDGGPLGGAAAGTSDENETLPGVALLQLADKVVFAAVFVAAAAAAVVVALDGGVDEAGVVVASPNLNTPPLVVAVEVVAVAPVGFGTKSNFGLPSGAAEPLAVAVEPKENGVEAPLDAAPNTNDGVGAALLVVDDVGAVGATLPSGTALPTCLNDDDALYIQKIVSSCFCLPW
jgi:hypothetical protein